MTRPEPTFGRSILICLSLMAIGFAAGVWWAAKDPSVFWCGR